MAELICGYLERSEVPERGGGRDPVKIVHSMAASLAFGRRAAFDVWAEGPVALGRVKVASGKRAAEAGVHRRGPFAISADLRLPDRPEDDTAHNAVFQALDAGTFPDSLDGDFALAIWDGARNALILARDRLGIRPLFLAATRDGGLAFASFPDALIDGGVVEGRFLPREFAELHTAFQPVRAGTWIEGVRRLVPGHVMTITPQREHLRRYWRHPVARWSQGPGHGPEDHAAAADALRSALESSVRRALPSHGPVSTLLSGGLDSGGITALAADLAGGAPADVTACCVTMPEDGRALGGIDEEPTARAVARQAGVTLVTFPYDMVRDGLFGPLSRTFFTADSPDHAYDRIVAHAAARGSDRLLCGFGGDEVVSYTGEGAVLADFLTLRWRVLHRTARELSQPLWRALAREAAGLLPSGLESRLRQAAGGAKSSEPLRTKLLRPGFRPPPRWRPMIGPAHMQQARLANAGFHHRLEMQAWQAARHGLRYVFPLLDWRLLEFAAGLPARLQLHGGMRRALFRTAVADLLPQEIVKRPTKLNPSPTLLYDLAVNREALIAEAQRVSASPAASAVVDLSEIQRQLAALPEAEAVAEAIRAQAAQGLPIRDPRVALVGPFVLARALAQNEAECAARAGPRPRAA